MQDFNIVLYKRRNGRVPLDDFLNGLNSDAREEIMIVLDNLGKDRTYLSLPHSKPLKRVKGLFELRIQCNQLPIRLLYFYGKNHDIVITNGLIKKNRQIPEREKSIAEKYFKDWCSRGN